MTVEKDQWPEPPARVYPHRYAYCPRCSRVVRDFQCDEVWRDNEGHITCDHAPHGLWHNRPDRVTTPPGNTDGGA